MHNTLRQQGVVMLEPLANTDQFVWVSNGELRRLRAGRNPMILETRLLTNQQRSMYSGIANGRIAILQSDSGPDSMASVTVYEIDTYREVARLGVPQGMLMPESMAIDPKGEAVAIANHEERFLYARIEDARWSWSDEQLASSVTGCTFNENGSLIWAHFSDQGGAELLAFDVSDGTVRTRASLDVTFVGDRSANSCATTSLSPDGKLLLAYVYYPLLGRDDGPYASLNAFRTDSMDKVWSVEISTDRVINRDPEALFFPTTKIRFADSGTVLIGSFDGVLRFSLHDGTVKPKVNLRVPNFIHDFVVFNNLLIVETAQGIWPVGYQP